MKGDTEACCEMACSTSGCHWKKRKSKICREIVGGRMMIEVILLHHGCENATMSSFMSQFSAYFQ
jgi:hypothetical protein